jgi:hypothetical protein
VRRGDVVLCYTNREQAGYDDAKLIADNLNAIRTIAALHQRVFDGYLMQDVCAHCSDDDEGRWATWPCQTMRIIAQSCSDESGEQASVESGPVGPEGSR